jgi:hypothetical protein
MNAEDAHSLMPAPMIARTGSLDSMRHRKKRDYQPPSQPPICPTMPGGRAIAAVLHGPARKVRAPRNDGAG